MQSPSEIQKKLHYDISTLSGLKLALEILLATEKLSLSGEAELEKAICILGQACTDFRATISLIDDEIPRISPPEHGAIMRPEVPLL